MMVCLLILVGLACRCRWGDVGNDRPHRFRETQTPQTSRSLGFKFPRISSDQVTYMLCSDGRSESYKAG